MSGRTRITRASGETAAGNEAGVAEDARRPAPTPRSRRRGPGTGAGSYGDSGRKSELMDQERNAKAMRFARRKQSGNRRGRVGLFVWAKEHEQRRALAPRPPSI